MDMNRKTKNRCKKLFSFLVVLCLTVGLVLLMSVPVQANVTTALTFNTTASTSGTGYNWVHTTRTLTLNNFTQNLSNSTTTPIGITLPTGSTIILVGTNNITGNNNSNYTTDSHGILANGNLTIGGTGTLNVSSSRGNNTAGAGTRAIQASGILTINSGIINATGNNMVSGNNVSIGISAMEGININGGTITATAQNAGTSFSIGIFANGTITINGGTITATSGTSTSNNQALGIMGGVININGGSVTARGNHSAFNRAPNLPASFNAWVNTNNVAPSGSPSTSYTYNANHRSVRIDSIIPAAAVTVNGNTNPITGAARISGVNITTNSPNFTASVSWNPNHTTFAVNTVYTATVTLTAINGFSFRNFSGTTRSINGTNVPLTPSSNGATATMAMTFPATAPAAPTAITATYSQNYITARWDSTRADSYRLDVSTTSDFSDGMILTGQLVTGNYHRVTQLLPETKYFYRVRAVVDGIESANSNVISVTTASLSRTAIVNDQTSANFIVDSDNLQNVLDNHIVTDEDIANNNSVILTLTVKETDDLADGADSIIKLSQGRLLQFFDITVKKQINNDPPVKLPELPVPVEITIDLSSQLSGKTGYTVYRYHGGVQRIGTDTETDEFFTVSRGSGLNNVDQIIIHTKNFSTFAVVENIKTLTGVDIHEDVDVQARIIDLATPVYKIDIEWGDMKFIYNLNGSAGTWNPETQRYDNPVAEGWSGFEDGNNEIIVWNHSNADVSVSFTVTNIEFNGDVDMSVYKDNDENGIAAVNIELGKVPLPNEDAPNIKAYLRLSGEPPAAKIEELKNADAWHKVGIITVTITPDGDILTHRRLS